MTAAALGSVMWLVAAPGIVVGLMPWWITGWHSRFPEFYWAPMRFVGVVLVVAGTAVLVTAFARFVVEGLGTPAPIAPTEHLVVGGLYRFVRNPMYLAVFAGILGQVLMFARFDLLWYLAAIIAVSVAFVSWYEEPKLTRQFGSQYERYRRVVPAWWPTFRPESRRCHARKSF